MSAKLVNLAKQLKLEFKNKELIQNAFVHRSYLNESKRFLESNERLEFLGDAVLELIVTDFLYSKYPRYQEGMLTNLRAALVKTTTLAEFALSLGLDDHILMSKGEESTGGRKNKSLLADTIEAFIGALYLDLGSAACRAFLEEQLFPQIDSIIESSSYKDSKSSLQEIAQAKFKETPIYEVTDSVGPDHDKIFTVQVVIGTKQYAKGQGKSKQLAQEEAARETLEILTNN